MINVHILAGEEFDEEILINTILNEYTTVQESGMLKWYINGVAHIAVLLDDEDQATYTNIVEDLND